MMEGTRRPETKEDDRVGKRSRQGSQPCLKARNSLHRRAVPKFEPDLLRSRQPRRFLLILRLWLELSGLWIDGNSVASTMGIGEKTVAQKVNEGLTCP